MNHDPAALDDLLADILVTRGLVEPSRIEEWRREKSGSRLTDYLLARGYPTPDALNLDRTLSPWTVGLNDVTRLPPASPPWSGSA